MFINKFFIKFVNKEINIQVCNIEFTNRSNKFKLRVQ